MARLSTSLRNSLSARASRQTQLLVASGKAVPLLLLSKEFVATGAINLFEPESIRITDEAHELLVELGQVTGLGKSGLVDAAIRLLANRFIDNDPDTVTLIEQSKNNRSFSETVSDILNNAVDLNKQKDK